MHLLCVAEVRMKNWDEWALTVATSILAMVSFGISHTKFRVPSVLRRETSCHGDTFSPAVSRIAKHETFTAATLCQATSDRPRQLAYGCNHLDASDQGYMSSVHAC